MRNIVIICCFALVSACSSESKKAVKEDIAATHFDTLTIGNKIYKLQDLTDTNFVFEKVNYPDSSDAALIAPFSNYVKRVNDTLELKCDNGRVVKLKSNITQSDDFKSYGFMSFNKDINSYIVFCTLVESGDVWLINKFNGDSLCVVGYPVVSPNKKQFVCANADLEAGFSLNGLELYNYNNNSYTSLGLRELTEWGPEKFMWKNDTTLIIKAALKFDGQKTPYKYKALYVN